MADKKIGEMEILRAIGALGVIIIHVTSNFAEIKYINLLQATNLYIDFLFNYFVIPCFVFISGFVLSRKYFEKYDSLEFLIKRTLSILPQYLLFSIGYVIYTSIIVRGDFRINIFSLIIDLICGNSYYHLWFIPALLQLYLIYPFIAKLYSKHKNSFIITSFIIAVGWNLTVLILNILKYPFMEIFIKLSLNKSLFVAQLFWFVLGIHIARNYEEYINKIKKFNLKHLLVGVLLSNILIISPLLIGLNQGYVYYEIPRIYLALNIFLSPFYIVLEMLFFFVLSIKIVNQASGLYKTFNLIGYYSFGIYLVHALMLDVSKRGLDYVGIDYNSWAFYPLAFIMTVMFSYLFTYIISYLPFSKWIIGVERCDKLLSDKKIIYDAN